MNCLIDNIQYCWLSSCQKQTLETCHNFLWDTLKPCKFIPLCTTCYKKVITFHISPEYTLAMRHKRKTRSKKNLNSHAPDIFFIPIIIICRCIKAIDFLLIVFVVILEEYQHFVGNEMRYNNK